MSKKVFLGGTCGESIWRDELIPQLKIRYFNPVVDDWTENDKKIELQQRTECDYLLYVITSDMEGVYSIAELIDDSNKRPEATIVCVIEGGFSNKQISSLNSVIKMASENGATICNNLEDVANTLNRLGSVSGLSESFFLR